MLARHQPSIAGKMLTRACSVWSTRLMVSSHRRPPLAIPLLVFIGLVTDAAARPFESRPRKKRGQRVEETTSPVQPGLLPVQVDAAAGSVRLHFPRPAAGGLLGRYLLTEGLTTGLGANDIGLDRGQLGRTRVVRFRRLGKKVLLEEENVAFRAEDGDADARRAVEEAFARSVIWSTTEVKPTGDGLAVDLTGLVLSDLHGVVGSLRSAGAGSFSLDASRSALLPEACRSFPDNVVLEGLLTFTSGQPGDGLSRVVPDQGAITLQQRVMLLRLPDGGYQRRIDDPRAGAFSISFHDHSAALDEQPVRRFSVRHRLEKVDPSAERSRVVEPIVYHVDRGVPEPIRSAVIEGASWWAEAFEAAGFIDAYRVELLPEGVDPLDVRYNTIEWVHRSTRGWSYGDGVLDPRTGERLQGHVVLGSLRLRQDRLLFEGLVGTAKTGSGAPDDPVQVALARIRQLAAHEVGHCLGLRHEFSASARDRASVMDYPAPLVRLRGARVDLSEAYDVGVGSWDVLAIRHLYQEWPGRDLEMARRELLEGALAGGEQLLTDSDARSLGATHPLANLWDNGSDPIAELHRLLDLRRHALARFGPDRLTPGQPVSLLQERLVPVYLLHRFQVEATAKSLAGAFHRHSVTGDERRTGLPSTVRSVGAAEQRRALNVLLRCVDADELDIPDRVVSLLSPRGPGAPSNRELFRGSSAPIFDPLDAAATAADRVFAAVFQPQRCARLIEQHRRDPGLPSLDEVLRTVIERVGASTAATPRLRAVEEVVRQTLVHRLVTLAGDASAPPRVRARVRVALEELQRRLSSSSSALDRDLGREIESARARRLDASDPAPRRAPPGSPIGAIDAQQGCSHHGASH
ncbi:MAG: zinc-dependent metalloprotease [Acidobacteriota bacterium]